MSRFIFTPSNVSASGAQARVSVFLSQSATRPVTDLWRVDASDNLTDAIPRGMIVSSSLGAIGTFAGPDNVDKLWLEVNGNSGSRTQVSAVRSSGAEVLQAPILLINTPGDLPVDTPVGTIVVVKNP